MSIKERINLFILQKKIPIKGLRRDAGFQMAIFLLCEKGLE